MLIRFILFFIFSFSAFADAVIFSGNDVRALKQNLSLNEVVKLLSGGLNPTVTGVASPIGSLYLSTTGTMYLKTGVLDTDWTISRTGLVNLNTDVTGVLPISNGGTGSSVKNFVDLTTSQSKFGDMTFINDVNINGVTSLSSSLTGPLKATSGVVISGNIDLTSEVSGVLPIANGGTGSSTKNFVDLTTAQSIGGLKIFSDKTVLNNDVDINGELSLNSVNAGPLKKNEFTGIVESAPIDLATEVIGSLSWNENGNGNHVRNPSFEQGLQHWTCTPTTDVSPSMATDGQYSATFDTGSGARICVQTFDLPVTLTQRQIEYALDVNASGNVTVCTVGANPNKCETYIGGSGLKTIRLFSYPEQETGNGISFQRTTTSATTFENFDMAWVGDIRGGTIASDLKSATIPVSYTPTFEGVVATIHNAKYYRDGEFLNVTIDITPTSTSPVPATFSLPSGLTVDTSYYSSTGNYPVGYFIRGNALPTYQSPQVVLFDPAVTGKLFVGSMSSSTSVYTKTNGNAWVGASERVTINFTVKISQWANSSLDVAATQCQLGNSLCAKSLTFSYLIGASTVTDEFGTTYPVVSSGDNNYMKTINITSLGLSNPLKCNGSTYSNIGAFGITNQGVTGNTNTSLVINTANLNNTTGNLNFNVTCTKQGTDIKNPYQFTNLQNFYVDANEIQVGWDRIDNKPIYQRCFNVASTTSGYTLTNGVYRTYKLEGYASNGSGWYSLPYGDSLHAYNVYVSSGELKVGVSGSFTSQSSRPCVSYTKN